MDILLDVSDNLRIENGDFVIGDSVDQEVSLILRMHKGELKEDPLVGCDLITLLKSNVTNVELKQLIKLQLARDGKSYDELKEQIQLKTN